MFSKIFGLVFAVAAIIVLPLLAGTTHTAGQTEERAFTGQLVCLGCSLKGNDGARPDCNLYGHNMGLKMRDGRYVHVLENRYSEDLLSGRKYGDNEVVLHARFFPAANMVDVRSFEIDGQEFSWCGNCREMDLCALINK
jgi:hypothetical protein